MTVPGAELGTATRGQDSAEHLGSASIERVMRLLRDGRAASSGLVASRYATRLEVVAGHIPGHPEATQHPDAPQEQLIVTVPSSPSTLDRHSQQPPTDIPRLPLKP